MPSLTYTNTPHSTFARTLAARSALTGLVLAPARLCRRAALLLILRHDHPAPLLSHGIRGPLLLASRLLAIGLLLRNLGKRQGARLDVKRGASSLPRATSGHHRSRAASAASSCSPSAALKPSSSLAPPSPSSFSAPSLRRGYWTAWRAPSKSPASPPRRPRTELRPRGTQHASA